MHLAHPTIPVSTLKAHPFQQIRQPLEPTCLRTHNPNEKAAIIAIQHSRKMIGTCIRLALVVSCCCQSSIWAFLSTSAPQRPLRAAGVERSGTDFFKSRNPRESVRLFGNLLFSGDSSHRLVTELADESAMTPLDYLASTDSDYQLLGNPKAVQRPDGLWDSIQPNVNWIGMDLVPVFVNSIERSGSKARILVVDARTDIANAKSGPNPAEDLIVRVMKKSIFSGESILYARKLDESGKWELCIDLTISLEIPLPPFVLLPPGFNSIGSSIIKSTCRTRSQKCLDDFEKAYQEWAVKNLSSQSS